MKSLVRGCAFAFLFLSLLAWASGAQAQCSSQPATVGLVIQGTTSAGSVTVSNDQSNLYVMVATTGDWTITQLDVDAGLTLGALHGSNLAGYPFRTTLNPTVPSYTFAIPLGSFQVNDNLLIAVHARLVSPTQGAANAWGAGTLFPGAKVCGICSGSEHEGEDDHGGSGYSNTSGHSTVTLFGASGTNGSHSGGEDDCDDDAEHSGDGGSCGGSQKSLAGHSTVSLAGNSSTGGNGSHGTGTSGSHGNTGGSGSHGSTGGSGGSGSGDDHHGSGGGSSDGHHGDDGHHDDGGHDDGGHSSGSGCGATYFTYTVTCGGGPVK